MNLGTLLLCQERNWRQRAASSASRLGRTKWGPAGNLLVSSPTNPSAARGKTRAPLGRTGLCQPLRCTPTSSRESHLERLFGALCRPFPWRKWTWTRKPTLSPKRCHFLGQMRGNLVHSVADSHRLYQLAEESGRRPRALVECSISDWDVRDRVSRQHSHFT